MKHLLRGFFNKLLFLCFAMVALGGGALMVYEVWAHKIESSCIITIGLEYLCKEVEKNG